MPTFGLITEGETDHPVLRHILSGFFGKDMSAEIIALPENRHKEEGGWYYVLRLCESPDFTNFLETVDMVVIHLDSDVSEQAYFNVPQKDAEGNKLEPAVLVENIRENIRSRIRKHLPPEAWAFVQDKILFAIAVNRIECWLLPLHTNDARLSSSTTNCYKLLNQLTPDVKMNAKGYEDLSRAYRQPEILLTQGRRNPSLALFLDELEEIG